MKRILPVIFISFIIAACSTIPREIDDKYMAEKTESDSRTIFALEQKIIEKNKEKQAVDTKKKEQAKAFTKSGEEIKLLKEENGLLKDQVYFYEKNKDAVNLELKKTQLNENETKLARKTAMLKYQESEKKLLETELDLKNAELAELIAELNFEKSKIAAAYRDRNEPPKPEEEENFFTKLFNKKDPDDKYGYKKYGEHLEKKKQDTVKALKNYSDAEKKYQEAKVNLEKTK